MVQFLMRRLLSTVVVVWGVSSLIFVILNVTSDPVQFMLSEEASREDYEELRQRLGLDRPLHVQYMAFLGKAVRLDFGTSFRYGQPALSVVLARYPHTLLLAVSALTLALVLSIPLSILSAAHRNTFVDGAISTVTFLGQAVPVFWLGIMLIIIFGVNLGWFPTFGSGTWRHLVLPTIALAVYPLAQFVRLTRSEMLETLQQDYVRTARAKGLRNWRVLLRHAFANAVIPLINLVGLTFGALLSGAVITETIFAWPGVGRLVIQAISFRDLPLIQASVASIAFVFVLVNLGVDLLAAYANPRVRIS